MHTLILYLFTRNKITLDIPYLSIITEEEAGRYEFDSIISFYSSQVPASALPLPLKK